MQEGNERSEQEHRFEGATETYVTGPSWPSAATVNVSDVNPWSKQHWNLTHQGQIYKRVIETRLCAWRKRPAQRPAQRAFRERQMSAK